MSRIGLILFAAIILAGYPTQARADGIPLVNLPCPGCSTPGELSLLGYSFIQQWMFSTPPGYPEGQTVEPWVICYGGDWPWGDCIVNSTSPTAVYIYSDRYAFSYSLFFESITDGYIKLQGYLGDTDADFDNVADQIDNCRNVSNVNQADCDGDGMGNACDPENSRYVAVTREQTCKTDKDDHVLFKIFEHRVEAIERDVSSCGAPNRWHSWVRERTSRCFGMTDEICCRELTPSLNATGELGDPWCTTARNQNFCH